MDMPVRISLHNCFANIGFYTLFLHTLHVDFLIYNSTCFVMDFIKCLQLFKRLYFKAGEKSKLSQCRFAVKLKSQICTSRSPKLIFISQSSQSGWFDLYSKPIIDCWISNKNSLLVRGKTEHSWGSPQLKEQREVFSIECYLMNERG